MAALVVRPGGRFVDGTVGGGGHARALLEAAGPDARLLGCDRDPAALAAAEATLSPFASQVTLAHGRFSDIAELAGRHGFDPCDGLLLDLGVSSRQLDDASRGFSFSADAPLDMRMDPDHGESAAELLARLDVPGLARLLADLGEVPRPRSVARTLLRGGPPGTTRELASRAAAALGGGGRRRRHHPATQVFQALRIAVNDELGELARLLAGLPAPLAPGGRVAVIAYHSLEDRPVKQSFVRAADRCECPPRLPVCACGRRPTLELDSRRPARPTPAEIEDNPRARSARLRVARRPEDA